MKFIAVIERVETTYTEIAFDAADGEAAVKKVWDHIDLLPEHDGRTAWSIDSIRKEGEERVILGRLSTRIKTVGVKERGADTVVSKGDVK